MTRLRARSRPALFREMVDRMVERGYLTDGQIVVDRLLVREGVGSTGIKPGVAVPHAYIDQIDDSLIALGLSNRGIDFKAADGGQVHVVVLLLDSPKHKEQHLRLMAQLARLVDRPNLADDLLVAESPAAVLDILFATNRAEPSAS
ncbi:PTS sugar transporter subunit IIA [Candidatus Sumerlaeota bacterium]|nr:PTS sugar transporter subunit IIA [Candidatus Sumerlaeota bacterium]